MITEQEKDKHFYDAVYEVWRRGGNSDMVDYDKAEQDYYDGKDALHTAQMELNKQFPILEKHNL